MQTLKADMELFIIESPYDYNVGKQVRLIRYVQPGEVYKATDDVTFHGGRDGGWVVKPIHTTTMLSSTREDIPMIANVALIKEKHLSAICAREIVENEINPEDMPDITVFLLDDAGFDSFTKQLEDNPISKNKAVQELLARPRPWE